MNASAKRWLVGLAVCALGILLLSWPQISGWFGAPGGDVAAQTQGCTVINDVKQLNSPVLINFDTLPNGTVIGDSYRPSFGVRFEDTRSTRAIIYGNEPARTHSAPNVASNDAVSPGTSSGVPMNITFDTPKNQVGFWLGNGPVSGGLDATVIGYNAQGAIICRAFPVAHNAYDVFVGFSSPAGDISRVSIDYGQTTISEAIDDLYFAPGPGIAPTRVPKATWTPIPSPTPTKGPAPTATSLVPLYSYKAVKNIGPIIHALLPDFSIYGIEVTEGIQCFDTSKGLTTCADNSLPLVAKKDASARIYLRAANSNSVQSNVPVRLHLFANGVNYTVNTSGKTTTTLDQSQADSANVWFNVNFNSPVSVSFWAEVDPDHLIAESNESNNRYPAVGTINLTFTPRQTVKIVGQRLHYHPSGYSGTQDAGGWAVNGGGADWLEQVLPVRNNAITYSVKSGYLDWTTSLGSGDGQHALIQALNARWILENLFSFWFSGELTGARHVYGWAPSAGYSGGHADMPIYPHAGGLGVVGIGSDAAGTSTDNPGSGALIFGHELVHDYNIYHTNTADGCGSNDGNSNFPYSSSSIQEFGFNPITGKIYNPNNTHDLMSYCPSGGSKQGWISPFNWNNMFTNYTPLALAPLSEPANAPLNTFALAAASHSLQVNATVFNPLYQPAKPGALGALYRTDAAVSFLLTPGPYAVELRDGSSAVLASYPFAANFESEYHDGEPPAMPLANDPPPFPPEPTHEQTVSFIVPWADGTASIALVYTDPQQQKHLLDERFVSPNAPQVLITDPAGAQTWAAGSSHTLHWQGLDLDGDPLTYAVFYSNDGGTTWTLLAEGLNNPSYTVATDSLAGGSDTRFRVVATDGVNTGLDETDQAIEIPNHAPVPIIISPAPGQISLPDDLLVLQGSAMDMEDGGLPDEAMVWSSNVQGGLGIGPSVPLNALSTGFHTITLTATDKDGASSTASVTIFIGNPVYAPFVAR